LTTQSVADSCSKLVADDVACWTLSNPLIDDGEKDDLKQSQWTYRPPTIGSSGALQSSQTIEIGHLNCGQEASKESNLALFGLLGLLGLIPPLLCCFFLLVGRRKPPPPAGRQPEIPPHGPMVMKECDCQAIKAIDVFSVGVSDNSMFPNHELEDYRGDTEMYDHWDAQQDTDGTVPDHVPSYDTSADYENSISSGRSLFFSFSPQFESSSV